LLDEKFQAHVLILYLKINIKKSRGRREGVKLANTSIVHPGTKFYAEAISIANIQNSSKHRDITNLSLVSNNVYIHHFKESNSIKYT